MIIATTGQAPASAAPPPPPQPRPPDPAAVEYRLFTIRYRAGERPHVALADARVCQACSQPCLWFCPAGAYRLENGQMRIAYENCLECGTCRIACPYDNVLWSNPTGGCGIAYKRG